MAYGIYTLGVPLEWPQRLLHIPSMTSRLREPDNLYGNDREPPYAILSYTWGRYEVDAGPHLNIKGIDWRVPSIDANHFTVADLTHLLEKIGRSHDYVWIDIACIDQKRDKLKMEEVGRQAIIFKQAKRAYVWLNHYEPAIIQENLQSLMLCVYQLAEGKSHPPEAVGIIIDKLSLILKDPWFSSLWTLQESFLQRHAILVNKRGEPIRTDGPWIGESPDCQLMDISGACGVVRSVIDQALRGKEGADRESSHLPQSERLHSMRIAIDKSGIDFMLCPNPNIQYAAARFRQTTRSEDRIYAIMQAYGYRLGDSAPSVKKLKNFGLEDLEVQFLQALNTQSCVLGQAFQHLETPSPGQSWSITNYIRVPQRLHMIMVHDNFSSSACRIKVLSKNEAYFEGNAFTLEQLSEFCRSRRGATLTELEKKTGIPNGLLERDTYFSRPSRNYFFKQAKQGMIMDHNDRYDYTAMSHEWPPDTAFLDDRSEAIIENRVPELIEAAARQEQILADIAEQSGNRMTKLLYLGRTKHVESMEVALLLQREGSTREGLMMKKVPIWRRLGIYFWHVEGGEDYGLAETFKPMTGKFG